MPQLPVLVSVKKRLPKPLVSAHCRVTAQSFMPGSEKLIEGMDENLSRHLKHGLTVLGHDVTTTADEGLLSQPDVIVAGEAQREGRILLTLDIGFADLRKHPPGSHPGIILFRPRSFGPLAVNRFVEQFIGRTDLEPLRGCIVVVDATKVRVRRPSPN